MDGLVPKDRPNLDSRGLTPAETEKHSVSDQGEHRAQELGDLYFAADNYAVALEYYRRALDAEARKNGSVDRDALFRLGARIVDCLRYRGDLDEAVDARNGDEAEHLEGLPDGAASGIRVALALVDPARRR
jgi:tetratricopeptide (TPR) repeat protein